MKNEAFSMAFLLLNYSQHIQFQEKQELWDLICAYIEKEGNSDEESVFFAVAFLESIRLTENEFLDKNQTIISLTLGKMIAALGHTEYFSKQALPKILNCLSLWIMNDKFKIICKNYDLIQKLINNLDNLQLSRPELSNDVKIFTTRLLMTYLNFPAKNQNQDILSSILNEDSFKNLKKIRKYLEYHQSESNVSDDEIYNKVNSDSSKKLQKSVKNQKGFLRKKKSFLLTNIEQLDNNFERALSKVQFLQRNKSRNSKKEKEFLASNISSSKYEKLFKTINVKSINLNEKINKLLKLGNCDDNIDVINHIIHFNYPDQSKTKRLITSYNQISFFSFLAQMKDCSKIKVITRDNLGKFAWKIKHFNMIAYDLEKKYYQATMDVHRVNSKLIDQINQSSENVFMSNFEKWNERYESKKSRYESVESCHMQLFKLNKMESILQKIQSKIDQFQEYDQFYSMSDNIDIQDLKIFKVQFEQMEEDVKMDLIQRSLSHHGKRNFFERVRILSDVDKNFNRNLDKNKNSFYNWSTVRQFLNQMGYLYQNKYENLQVLDNKNDQFQNLVNIIDQTNNREHIKIGVIYIGKDQYTQKDILENSQGSQAYKKFLTKLGRFVCINKHLGFLGGLKEGSDGIETIHFSNSHLEMIYHVVTMMPTIDGDDQQIAKKRHIGNDHINIIWNDNIKDYRDFTISSQYIWVNIVIFPLKNNLFRIQVLKKNNIPEFFPWIHDMIIDEESLPILIKKASINAYRSVRSIAASTLQRDAAKFEPFLQRQCLLKEINSRFACQNYTPQSFYNILLNGNTFIK